MGALVSYRCDDGIAAITMDDGKVNVMSAQMISEIGGALDRAAADQAVVLLTGRPGVFSAGFDLPVLRAGGAPAHDLVEAGFELAARVLSYPAPVIMACTGHAVAMGLFLLLGGDYVVGVPGPYRLTANEVAIGLVMPATAIAVLRHRLTPAAAHRALALSEPFRADAAAVAAGFLDELVPVGELAAAARHRAVPAAALDRSVFAASKHRIRDPHARAVRAAIESDRAARDLRSAVAR
jgi:enoyl-CoA hydratase